MAESEHNKQPHETHDAHHSEGSDAPGGADRKAAAPPGGVWRMLRAVVRGLLALVFLAAGITLAWWFNWTEGKAQTGAPAEESARLVETVEARRQTARVVVRAMGNVRPAREVIVRPRVSGKIIEQSDAFVPGGHFDAGQMLLKIDPSDYQDTVQQRESDLQQAQATLKIERGDQAVAREELRLLEADIPEINRDLILRKPQVNQAKASVKSAKAALRSAEANLRRTTIEAPFDGHLISRSVTAGNNVSQGEQLATYVGSDRYWIELAIPVSHLRWLEVPGRSGANASLARITNPDTWGEEVFRRGRVTRLIGRLEAGSRMAQVLISVDDPLALSETRADKPRLILDAFVNVRLEGQQLNNVVVIDRAHLRNDDIVWVMNDADRLDVRDVSVVFRGKRHAYVDEGLDDGDRIITTNLSSPVPEMLLRTTAMPGNDRVAEAQDADNE
jgi:RND family efflux transporter MFP subunit